MCEKVEISKKRLDQLLEQERWLDCLEGAGVDNWEGIDHAIEDMLRGTEELEAEKLEEEKMEAERKNES